MEADGNASLYSRWTRLASQMPARLRSLSGVGRRWLVVVLAAVLLVFVGSLLLRAAMHHFAQARLRPSRAAYEGLLAQTRAVPRPDGTILIVDPDGAALSLRIDYFKEAGDRPQPPLVYGLVFNYDHVDISPQDDPTRSLSSGMADYGMRFSPGMTLTLKQAPDPALSTAISRLVDWSIADAQASAAPRYDIAASNDSDAYFARCDAAHGWFYLILRQHTRFNDLQAMNDASALGSVIRDKFLDGAMSQQLVDLPASRSRRVRCGSRRRRSDC